MELGKAINRVTKFVQEKGAVPPWGLKTKRKRFLHGLQYGFKQKGKITTRDCYSLNVNYASIKI